MRAVLAAAIAALLCGATPASAQTYPDRTITVIVPYAPGGNTDVIARIMLEGMTPHIGRFVIEIWRVNARVAQGLTEAQWISLALVALGGLGCLYFRSRPEARLSNA